MSSRQNTGQNHNITAGQALKNVEVQIFWNDTNKSKFDS
jgi:hypothetical protein